MPSIFASSEHFDLQGNQNDNYDDKIVVIAESLKEIESIFLDADSEDMVSFERRLMLALQRIDVILHISEPSAESFEARGRHRYGKPSLLVLLDDGLATLGAIFSNHPEQLSKPNHRYLLRVISGYLNIALEGTRNTYRGSIKNLKPELLDAAYCAVKEYEGTSDFEESSMLGSMRMVLDYFNRNDVKTLEQIIWGREGMRQRLLPDMSTELSFQDYIDEIFTAEGEALLNDDATSALGPMMARECRDASRYAPRQEGSATLLIARLAKLARFNHAYKSKNLLGKRKHDDAKITLDDGNMQALVELHRMSLNASTQTMRSLAKQQFDLLTGQVVDPVTGKPVPTAPYVVREAYQAQKDAEAEVDATLAAHRENRTLVDSPELLHAQLLDSMRAPEFVEVPSKLKKGRAPLSNTFKVGGETRKLDAAFLSDSLQQDKMPLCITGDAGMGKKVFTKQLMQLLAKVYGTEAATSYEWVIPLDIASFGRDVIDATKSEDVSMLAVDLFVRDLMKRGIISDELSEYQKTLLRHTLYELDCENKVLFVLEGLENWPGTYSDLCKHLAERNSFVNRLMTKPCILTGRSVFLRQFTQIMRHHQEYGQFSRHRTTAWVKGFADNPKRKALFVTRNVRGRRQRLAVNNRLKLAPYNRLSDNPYLLQKLTEDRDFIVGNKKRKRGSSDERETAKIARRDESVVHRLALDMTRRDIVRVPEKFGFEAGSIPAADALEHEHVVKEMLLVIAESAFHMVKHKMGSNTMCYEDNAERIIALVEGERDSESPATTPEELAHRVMHSGLIKPHGWWKYDLVDDSFKMYFYCEYVCSIASMSEQQDRAYDLIDYLFDDYDSASDNTDTIKVLFENLGRHIYAANKAGDTELAERVEGFRDRIWQKLVQVKANVKPEYDFERRCLARYEAFLAELETLGLSGVAKAPAAESDSASASSNAAAMFSGTLDAEGDHAAKRARRESADEDAVLAASPSAP